MMMDVLMIHFLTVSHTSWHSPLL